jgi:hypothetical protein
LSKNRTFRVRDTLDEQLQEAAEKSGRSVSEEIEHRLERSFSEDQLASAFLGGDHTAELLRAVSIAIWLVEQEAGKKWNEETFTCALVGRAAHVLALRLGIGDRLPVPSSVYYDLLKSALEFGDSHPTFGRNLELSATLAALKTLHKMGLAPSWKDILADAENKSGDRSYLGELVSSVSGLGDLFKSAPVPQDGSTPRKDGK